MGKPTVPGGKRPASGPSLLSPTAHVAAGVALLWRSDFDGAAAFFAGKKKGREGAKHDSVHPRALLHAADVDLLAGWVTGSSARRSAQLAALDAVDSAIAAMQKRTKGDDAACVEIARRFWRVRRSSASSRGKEQLEPKKAGIVVCDKVDDEAYDASSVAAQPASSAAVVDEDQNCVGGDMKDVHVTTNLPKNCSDAVVAANVRLDLDILAASSSLFRAVTQMQMLDRLKALYNLRCSWKLYEKLAKTVDLDGDDSATSDASIFDKSLIECVRFGVGLFYFIISFVPGAVAKVVEMVGFVGDRDKGIEHLRRVAESQTIQAPLAALVLLLNYLMIPKAFSDTSNLLKNAENTLDRMDTLYPGCPSFSWLRSHWYRKSGDVDSAILSVQFAIEKVDRSLGAPARNFMFDLGCCYFMKRDWNQAASVFEELTATDVQEFDLKGMSNLQLASCYIMLDREDDALERLRLMPSVASNKSRFDKVALAKASRCCARNAVNPFLGFEILYLRRDLAHLRSGDLEPLLHDLDVMALDLGVVNETDLVTFGLYGGASAASVGDADSALDALGASMKKSNGHKTSRQKKKTLRSTNAVALRATFHLIRGTAMIGLGMRASAAKSFREVVSLEKSVADEKYLIPFALYELAELEFNDGQLVEAESLLLRAKKYSGYDWEEALSNRIRLAVKKLDDDRRTAAKKT